MTHIETIKLMKSHIQTALNSYEIPMTAGVAEALTAANKAIGEGESAEKRESVFKARKAFWDAALGNNTNLANLAKAAIEEAEKHTALPHIELVGPTTQHYGRDNLMVVAAHRYCLGRSTYIVGDCVEWLLSIWNELPDKTKAIIQRDTEEAFKRDDEERAEGREFKTLGMDCDRAEWERLRMEWNHG